MPQPWPWVKVMERSSSTFLQTHIFFVPNMKGLAQTVLMWEGKVFAAADADADAAETDWKHKVTPERGDLMIATNVILVEEMSFAQKIFPVVQSFWNYVQSAVAIKKEVATDLDVLNKENFMRSGLKWVSWLWDILFYWTATRGCHTSGILCKVKSSKSVCSCIVSSFYSGNQANKLVILKSIYYFYCFMTQAHTL